VAGLVLVAQSCVGLAEAVQGVGFAVGITMIMAEGESLLVVIQGLVVVAGAIGQAAQDVEGVRFAFVVVTRPARWIPDRTMS
jgi:hypothetical protein